MKQLLVALLRAYRLVVSPLYGQVCRYYPSCSAYAVEAVEKHGTVRGGWLAVRRLGRCHPWAPGGVDLVPVARSYQWWGRAPGTDGEDASISRDHLTIDPATIPASPAGRTARGA